MRTPITSSLQHDIMSAVLAKVMADMGQNGSNPYSLPDWLKIVKAGWVGGRPQIRIDDDECPAVWMQYVAGGEARGGEFPSRLGTMATELFVFYAVFVATPDGIGVDRHDYDEFAEYAEAAAGYLTMSLLDLLVKYDPSVTCPVTGYKTNSQDVTAWSYNGVATTDGRIKYTIMLRYQSMIEL